jgi:hypothetical protein
MTLFYLLFFLLIIFFILYAVLWSGNSGKTNQIIQISNDTCINILNDFAQSITQKDLLSNSELFAPGATINFSKLMSWLPNSAISVADWIEQLTVFQAEFVTNHMTMVNKVSPCRTIGYYTYTLDVVGNTTSLPTIICSFTARFDVTNALITYAEVESNATCTFLWYSSSGVDGTLESPMMKKRVIPDIDRWNILQNQINELISVGQRNLALSLCNTTQYLTLKAMFDPMGTNPLYQCNTNTLSTALTVPMTCTGNGKIDNSCLPDSYEYLAIVNLNLTNLTCPNGYISDNDSCFPQRIGYINMINAFPPTDDFTIVGGPGIQITGMIHGIQIKNLGVLGVVFLTQTPIFNGTFINQILFLKPILQPANTFYAAPVSGPPGEPVFRYIVDADITSISATKITGILPVEYGGTGSGVTLMGGKFMISLNNTIVEGPPLFGSNETSGILVAGDGIVITPVNQSFVISASPRIDEVDILVPTDIFFVASPPFFNGPAILQFGTQVQLPHTFWAGPASGVMSVIPTFRLLLDEDLPNNISMSKLVGILSVENGGTGSGTSLNNNTFMISYNGKIVEASFINTTGMTVSVAGGGIVFTNDGLLQMSLSMPSDLFSVSGSPTSGNTGSFTVTKQPQVQKTFLAGPILGSPMDPTFRKIELTDLPPLLDGEVYVGSGGTPVAGMIMAGTNINITYGPGTIIISSGTGSSFTSGNGTVTSVGLSLPLSVFQITNSPVTNAGVLTADLQLQTVNTIWAGPSSGMSAQPTFRMLVVADMPVVPAGEILIGTGTGMASKNLTAGAGINIYYSMSGQLIIESTTLGTVTSISMTVPTSVFSVTPLTITSSGTFAVTLISQTANTFFASPSGTNGIPTFRTMTTLDLPPLNSGEVYIGSNGTAVASTLTAGVGITILTGAGSIEIQNAMTIGMTVPVSIMSVTPSSVTGNGGTFAISLITQLANRIFAGPASGGAAIPTFRSIVLADLPALGNGQLYIGSAGTPVISSLAAGTGITITPGPGTITVSNTGVVSVGLALPVSVFTVSGSPVMTSGTLTGSFTTQTANTVFAGPTSGGAATPTFRPLVAADIPAVTSLNTYEVSDTVTISAFSSLSFTLITTMTVTPVAGTYHVIFSSSGQPTTSSGNFEYTIFNGITQLTHSARTFTGSSSVFTLNTQGVVVANGSDAITIQWRRLSGSGSASIFQRSMFLLRIA